MSENQSLPTPQKKKKMKKKGERDVANDWRKKEKRLERRKKRRKMELTCQIKNAMVSISHICKKSNGR
jgi:hypothetical protein